jgi:hypothetical protein
LSLRIIIRMKMRRMKVAFHQTKRVDKQK